MGDSKSNDLQLMPLSMDGSTEWSSMAPVSLKGTWTLLSAQFDGFPLARSGGTITIRVHILVLNKASSPSVWIKVAPVCALSESNQYCKEMRPW